MEEGTTLVRTTTVRKLYAQTDRFDDKFISLVYANSTTRFGVSANRSPRTSAVGTAGLYTVIVCVPLNYSGETAAIRRVRYTVVRNDKLDRLEEYRPRSSTDVSKRVSKK